MITHTTEQASQTDRRAIPTGTPCFYCHYPLKGNVVMWWGAGADIYLHPGCTVELSIRLLSDVHGIEHTTHTSITAGASLPLTTQSHAA